MLGKRLYRIVVLCFVLHLSGVFSGADTTKTADMKTIAAAGHVNSKEYENSYFGVSVQLPQPNDELKLNTLVSDNRAILLLALSESHQFAIVTHSNAGIQEPVSTAVFVRSVRHQLESEGLKTVKMEVPVLIGGHEFIQSDLKMESKDQRYWKAVMFTQIKGNMFGFWMETKSQADLNEITKLDGRVRFR